MPQTRDWQWFVDSGVFEILGSVTFVQGLTPSAIWDGLGVGEAGIVAMTADEVLVADNEAETGDAEAGWLRVAECGQGWAAIISAGSLAAVSDHVIHQLVPRCQELVGIGVIQVTGFTTLMAYRGGAWVTTTGLDPHPGAGPGHDFLHNALRAAGVDPEALWDMQLRERIVHVLTALTIALGITLDAEVFRSALPTARCPSPPWSDLH